MRTVPPRRDGRRSTRSRSQVAAATTTPPVAATTGAGSDAAWTRTTGRASVPASTGAPEPFDRACSDVRSRSSTGTATLLPGAERFLVQPIGLDDAPAHRLHAAVHRLVDLQDPPHLAASGGAAGGLIEVFHVELRGHAGVLELRLHAEREDANAGDLLLVGEEPEPAEREQAAVQLRQHLVPVEQRERRAHGRAVLLGHPRPALVEQRLQLLRVVLELGLGERHEAPVLLPGRVVDLHEAADLVLEVLLAHV